MQIIFRRTFFEMASSHLKLLLFLVLLNQESVRSQTIEYTITEDNTNSQVMDIIQDSGLGNKYSTEILQQIVLGLVESEYGYHKYFAIDAFGYLTLNQTIDREEFCSQEINCILNLDIEVSQPREYWQIFKVNINILDINDNSPIFFDTALFEIPLSEVSVPGLSISLPVATDKDSIDNGIKMYTLSGDHIDTFSLQVETASDGSLEPYLRLDSQLDREQVATYSMELSAIDGGTPSLTGTVTVIVRVKDINDQYPEFTNKIYEVSIFENQPAWTKIITAEATDSDEGENAEIIYSFKFKNTEEDNLMKTLFDINESTGDIFVIGDLDYEIHSSYTLTVVAENKGQPSISSQAKVVINLMDVNDNSPVIKLKSLENRRANVPENKPNNTFVAHLSVTDKDTGDKNGKFNCTTYSDTFALQRINENDFKLVTKIILNRETISEYVCDVICQDFGDRALATHLQVPITVTDENDNTPIFDPSTYVTELTETKEIGQQIVKVKASDKDLAENGRITYSIQSQSALISSLFDIDQVSGDIKNVKPIDYEFQSQIELEIVASDNGSPPKHTTASVTINIADTDDEAAQFNRSIYNFAVRENKPINTYVGTAYAVDADSYPFNTVSYSIQNNLNAYLPFRIDSDTGDIFTNGDLDRENLDSYSFVVVARGPRPFLLGSSAMVHIFIADANDHSPRFVFPNSVNNTVYIESKIEMGTTVCIIYGVDPDVSDNALLRYSIVDDEETKGFAVDEYTGAITTTSDFQAVSDMLVITVRVQDSGEDPFSDIAYLNLVFGEPHGNTNADINQDIVIAIAVIASIIVTVLILTIIGLLCRRYRLIQQHKTLMAIKGKLEPSLGHTDPIPDVVIDRYGIPLNMDVSLQSSIAGVGEKPSMLISSGPMANGLVYDSERDSIIVQPWGNNTQKPDLFSNHHQYNNHSHHQAALDSDADSACSLGDSNTDSGRGSHNDEHNVTDPSILYTGVQPVLTYKTQTHTTGALTTIALPQQKIVPTRHLQPGVHNSSNTRTSSRDMKPLHKQTMQQTNRNSDNSCNITHNTPDNQNSNHISSQYNRPTNQARVLDFRRDSYRNILDRALEERDKKMAILDRALEERDRKLANNNNKNVPISHYGNVIPPKQNNLEAYKAAKQQQLNGLPKKSVHYCSQV